MLREISRQSIFDAALRFGSLTFDVFVEVDSRQPVAEFQLQSGADALGQLADLLETRRFRAIKIADTCIADASAVLRWMIR